jgi:multiple sugar transport system permease protein
VIRSGNKETRPTEGAVGLNGSGKPAEALGKQNGASIAMLAPFIILFAAFFIVPVIYAIDKSLQSPRGGGYAGWSNFSIVLHSSSGLWSGVGRVAYIGVIQIVVMLGLGMVLALLLDSPYCKGKRIFAVIYFLPYAVPGVIASIMWGFLLTPSVDSLVRTVGVNPLSLSTVLYSIILIVVWEFMGYNMTIYLTGLSQIPPTVLEAAKIDGCSELQLIRHIKLPMLRRMVLFTAVLSIIGTLQLFNEPKIISQLVQLSPTYTPNIAIYNEAFQSSNIPFAAAESLVLAVITITATVAFYTITRRRGARSSTAGPAVGGSAVTGLTTADPAAGGRAVEAVAL